jgi:Tfp pilus assembly protein PilF
MDNKLLNQAKNHIIESLKAQEFALAEIIAEQTLVCFNALEIQKLLGIAKMGLNKHEEARDIFLNNLNQKENDEDYNNLCITYKCLGDLEKSYEAGCKALKLNPSNSSAWANLASTTRSMGKYRDPVRQLKKAIELNENPVFYIQLSNIYFHHGKLDDAEKLLKKAVKLDPNQTQAIIDIFYCLAMKKEYDKAWPFYEYRYITIPQVTSIIQHYKIPLYDKKKKYYEEKICILYEQGHGDNLMYLRFVEKFQQIAPHSYLLSKDTVLHPVVEKMAIKHQNYISPDTEFVICIMSLPWILDIKQIPVPEFPVKHTPVKTEKLKVGLVWAGSALHPMDYQRSTYLNWYKDFLNDSSLELFSFMKDRRNRKYKFKEDKTINYSKGFQKYKIKDFSEQLHSALDTATLLNQIDVLVTVDTFTAHIAGSMGVPTYLIVSNLPDWRWGKTETESDWYPSIKIFRKSTKRSFKSVIKTVYKKIKGDYK